MNQPSGWQAVAFTARANPRHGRRDIGCIRGLTASKTTRNPAGEPATPLTQGEPHEQARTQETQTRQARREAHDTQAIEDHQTLHPQEVSHAYRYRN